MRKRKSFLASLMLSSCLATAANAEGMKIGVLNDQSRRPGRLRRYRIRHRGPHGGPGLRRTVAGMPVEVVSADHQTR